MSHKNTLQLLCLSLIVIVQSCSVNKAKIDNDLKKIFDDHKTNGCFAMLNNAGGEITVYNIASDTTRYSPGSSFIIPVSLIALQTGIIPDENQKLYTDSTLTDSLGHRDTISLSHAFATQNNFFFQRTASDIGDKKFKFWLDSLHYGNQQYGISLANSWNNHSLAISPDEQLGLLKKLYFDQLPFRKSVQETVRNMMRSDDNSVYSLSLLISDPISNTSPDAHCWALGWIEENRHVYFFVTLTESRSTATLKETTRKLTNDILTHYGFFKGKK